MAENNPLLDRTALENSIEYPTLPTPVDLPNIPFKGINTPLPTVDGNPTPSAVSAIENNLLSIKPQGGPLTGGSIPRTLSEVMSERYDTFVPGDYDNEDAYAQGQGLGSKMVNGVGKGLVLTGTTFLQSTAGLVNGVARMIGDGRAASFYDNEFNRALDDLNKKLENSLPNYYTNVEKNAKWYSPDKLVTANFFWDGIVKNLGFAAGAALAGGTYAYGLRALPLTARLFSVGRAAETLAATEEALMAANKVAEGYGKIRSLSDKFLGSYNVLTSGGRAVVAGLATTGEAGFEAYHNLNEFRNQKIEEYKATHNGVEPIGGDLDRINEQADAVGNASFLLNTALLSATNYIQFPKILGSSYNAEKGVLNNEISDIVQDATGSFVKQEAKTKAGRILSTLNRIRPYTFSTSEAFEEGAQYAISVGTKDYYDKKYDGNTADFIDSITAGIAGTLGTDEGMENVLIGGLSGTIMQARGRFRESAEISRNTADALQRFNNWRLSDFTKATVDSVNRGTVLQQERENALRQGDILTSKDLEADYIINYLTPRIKYGRFDLVQTDIDDYKKLASTEEGFAQLQSEGKALATDSRSQYLQRLSNLETTASNVKSLYQSLQLRYGGLRTKDGQPLYSPEVMDKMIYAASKVADYDTRLPQLSISLLEKGILVGDLATDIVSSKEDKYLEAVKQIQALDVNSDIKDGLLQDLEDYSEILLRRKKFLDEYDQIKRNPQDHKEAPIGQVPKKETLTVKTKTGDKEVETGTEYFVGRVVEYDKTGKEVYRSPRITILGENEDGTIQIKDSQGNIKNISKSILEDYKLAKVSDTLSNKKAKFFMDHWNTIYEFNFGKGKKQRGRLEYSAEEGVLNFVYKDKSGKTRRIEVTGDQFVPKEGYSTPQIKAVGELTVAQQKSLDDFTKEQDTRISDKKSARLSILNDLFNEITDKHNKTVKLITQKQAEVANIQEELKDLEESIQSAESDKRSKSAFRFRSNAKKALEASIRLSRTKDQLEQEIVALETEKEELEFSADYISDLSQNIDELPTDSKEFLEDFKEQQSILENLVIENGKQINSLSKLIDSVQGALDSAVSYLKDLLNQFETKYPKTPLAIGEDLVEFLQQNPNFLKLKPNYLEDLRSLEDLVAQVEDLDITPSERHISELQSELSKVQFTLKEVEKEIKAKDLILSRFEEVAKKYVDEKAEQKKLNENKNLKQQFLGTADTGPQTVSTDKDYEPDAKKTDLAIVTSTKPATSSDLPHHVRANQFGANLDKLPNRTNIKGVIVTSKNESQIGVEDGNRLTGLMNFLKGDSDVDATKIVALVMVNEKGIPVGVDGKELENPTFDNIIVQVFPDPKLEWSKEFGGKSMFRKETTAEQIEFYKKEYSNWVNEQLTSPTNTLYDIQASFGIPQYVTILDDKGNNKRDYTAVVSVEEAGLIKKSDLKEKQDLIKVATVEETVDKGTTKFSVAPGRPLLNLPNGIVQLNNRKLTPNEASTIYEAIHQLAIEADPKSEKSLRLIRWLKSIIYWGTPKNATGYNSVFFEQVGDDFVLNISGKGKTYPFTPSRISNNKAEIISLLEQMYNNIQSGPLNKAELWNEPYEEIVNIDEKGNIQTKEWDNYRTYLLSRDGRRNEELPLSTQLKPLEKEGDVNRLGIYFTITGNSERYSKVPVPQVIKPVKVEPAVQDKFVLDGKKVNIFKSPTGKQVRFAASGADDIKILTGLDGDTVLQELTEKYGKDRAVAIMKNTIKQAILPQLEDEESFTIGDDEPAPKVEKPKKDIFSKVKEAKIEVSLEDEDEMSLQIEDIDDEESLALRVKLEKEIKSFEKENWPKAEKWLQSNFPTLPVYRVKNVIKATNGLQAWGMLKDSAIYVTENAEVGTIYHEVFEGIWKIFTTPQERSKVEQEFKDRKGSFVDRPTGQTIQYSEATSQQIKEQLAEEFRDYVLNPPKKKSFLSQIFSDLVTFIKAFFTGNKAISNTNELFKKIGSGYYKQYTPTSQLSFAKKGIIDIEEAFGNNASEFRIKDIKHDVVNDIMQHMTYLTLTDLIYGESRTGKELYDYLQDKVTKSVLISRKAAEDAVKAGTITQTEAQDTINNSISLWKTIKNEWKDIEEKHREYLKSYQVEFDENDEVILKDEDKSNKAFEQDATKIDVFKKADKKLRLLLATVPIITQDGKLDPSSINGAKLLPASQVFMTIMNRTHTSRNLKEMIDRIKTLSEENYNYKTLYNRLTKNTTDLSQFSIVSDTQLLTALWRTFKKQSPEVKNVYIFENGDVEVGDSNLSSAARQIASDFSNAIIKTVKGKNPYFEYSSKDKVFVGKPNSVRSVKITSPSERINFLKSLGIEFKVNEVNKLSSDKKNIFNEAVAGIKRSIEKAEKIATVNRKILDIRGRIHQLSLIQASIENPEFDSTFFNVKGERTQTYIGTNPVSDLHDHLSQIDNISQLAGTPYEYLLSDTFSQGSVILGKIFNLETGNRIKGGELLMKPGYADGTVNLENGKKKQSGKLTYKERIIQETNLNLAGYYYNLVPGDSSLEWMVYMGNQITPDSLLSGWKRVNDIFKDYFISELNLSREERSINEKKGRKTTDLRFLKPILGAELHNQIIKEKGTPEEVYTKYQSKIDKAVQSFIEQESNKFRDLLEKYEILTKTPEGNFITENISFNKGESMKEDTLKRQLNTLSANFAINNIELHKLIYSDPYQYSDELKRIKNANSPRQSLIHNSPEFNMSLNEVWNKGYNKEDIGYTDFTRDYFKTITASDVTGTSDLKDYGTFDETDGGGIISLKAHRWLRIKAGEWSSEEEKQYKYDIAYEKRDKNKELSKEEKKLLEQPNPSVKSTYTPLKPIVFGNKANGKPYNDIDLDKFALYPLSYRIMKEINPSSNAIKLYNKMQREDIDYLVFASGRKVGSEGTNSLYNQDGSFNQLPFNYKINIPHNIIAIQSEVPSKDEPLVTRGSQITKLVTLDFMNAGVPIDYKEGFEAWNKLTEDQKQKSSPLYKEIKHNQEVLEQLIEQGYQLLLNKLGIEQTPDGGFQITDFTKAAETLREEIFKREVNDNVVDSLTSFLNGSVILEATPAYQQVRNILYSIADKNVISAKISGGQKVQIPSTLFESVRPAGKNGIFQSDVLDFYQDEDGKRVCEIMVGRWFDSSLSDDKLLNYLNNTKEGQKILSGVAYRIPTQKQNSIDAFKIKQFLPREFGDSVVIPSALVKKVGSDFDIDKLYIYFKNIYQNLKGEPKLVPFVGYGQQAKDKLAKMYEEGAFLNEEQRKIINNWVSARKQEDKDDSANKLAVAIFGEGSYEQEVIDDFLDAKNSKDIQNRIIDRVYKQSLENEYIQSLENLISNPLNFENLIKPNSADQLKGLAKDITKAIGREEFDYSSTENMLSKTFMSSLRQAFVSGKYAIGIAAVNQTNHSLNQRQPIYIDSERFNKITPEDLDWLTGGTLNKKDIAIKFKDFNRIEIDGKMVASLSMVKNAAGENISDIIGQFIDGYVDISKGPWIMELGATPNVASTWLFLTKIGVPIETVAYFMNQPIIRDYLTKVENAGYSWLFIDDFVDEVKKSSKYNVDKSEINKVKLIPSNLKSTVGKDKFTPKEKAEQQFILTEFLKYAKMANHMFLVTQGSNWDTATFNDPFLVFKKLKQLEKAQSSIISSVTDLINNSFIRKLMDKVYDTRDALSTVLISDLPNTREVLEKVLTPYVDLTDREFVKIARKAVNDLFDWAVQNDRKLNTQVTNILLSDENAASEINDFVVSVRRNPSHPLFNNQVVKLITPHFDSLPNKVNNIKIKNKDNKVYDQNQMIYAFNELREYLKGENNPLYGSLVRLAVLQSGLSNSPISFTSLLPYDDFKEIYNKTLLELENSANLEDFYKLNVFERNNWNDDDLVPTRKARWKKSKSGEWSYNNNMKFYVNKVSSAIRENKIPQLVKINNKSREAENDVIVYTWEEGTKAQKDAKKKIGDYSYIKKGLFKKMYRGGQPYTNSYTITDKETGENKIITEYIYKMINAWGDSHVSDGVYYGANEFYSTPRESVIDNGFIKVENEQSDESILTYFDKPVKQTISDTKVDNSQNQIPC